MNTLQGKTLLITGSSRGIGLAIAKRAAQDGANIVVAAKSSNPHSKLPGTIFTAVKEIEQAGGLAMPIQMDLRDTDQVMRAVKKATNRFGGIDILVNNAGAISQTGTLQTSMKRFDLMFDVNVRGTFAITQACIPHMRRSENPHILMISPPLNMEARWFAPHVAHSVSKYSMSMFVLGMAQELRDMGIAVNALWPRTVIHTAALQQVPSIHLKNTRQPTIMADAAHGILIREARKCSGTFFIDEDVLKDDGVTDFDIYAEQPGNELLPNAYL
jgi:citronellol/citronellal dehydrogenase